VVHWRLRTDITLSPCCVAIWQYVAINPVVNKMLANRWWLAPTQWKKS
jgi:hypothetical protein